MTGSSTLTESVFVILAWRRPMFLAGMRTNAAQAVLAPKGLFRRTANPIRPWLSGQKLSRSLAALLTRRLPLLATRARLSDRFRSLISAEGQSELRQKAAQRQLKDPWDITENTTLMLSVILLAAMLLMPFLGRFRILSIAPVIFAFIAWSTNKNRAIEREIEETEFIPIPVKIREQSRTDKDGLQHLVCELDPMSNELPESFYPIHEDKEQRVVGIDVRAEVSQGLGHGDLALLVTYKTTVLALEPVK